MTVSNAIDRIREVNDQRENVHYLYLVDDDAKLEGVISIRDLLLHPAEALLKDIATYEDLFMANPDEDQEIELKESPSTTYWLFPSSAKTAYSSVQ